MVVWIGSDFDSNLNTKNKNTRPFVQFAPQGAHHLHGAEPMLSYWPRVLAGFGTAAGAPRRAPEVVVAPWKDDVGGFGLKPWVFCVPLLNPGLK